MGTVTDDPIASMSFWQWALLGAGAVASMWALLGIAALIIWLVERKR